MTKSKMFSCCRTNAKSTKNKDKQNKSKQTQGNDDTYEDIVNVPQEKIAAAKDVAGRKLIIPTIMVENGKTIDDHELNMNAKSNADMPVIDFATETETNGHEIAADITVQDQQAIVDSVQNDSDEQTTSKKSTPTLDTDNSIASVTINQIIAANTISTTPPLLETDSESPPADDLGNDEITETELDVVMPTKTVKNAEEMQNLLKSVTEELPAKSCLSRHNSTHTAAVKKRVNISMHTEVIEPDPLPPPPYALLMLDDISQIPRLADPALLNCLVANDLADVDVYDESVDDDVFSDSLPAPKRESMCAPYIERFGGSGWAAGESIDGVLPEKAFAHGLPDWFNEERINAIGCYDPPVTPVGRDELELRRQRLYADLLRAAQAAVEHSVRFMPTSADILMPLNGYEIRSDRRGKTAFGKSDTDEACDSDFKPSVAENLESLVFRLEKLVERLERSISARELEIANRAFDTVLEKKRESFDLETAALPPVPQSNSSNNDQDIHLAQRIGRIENSLNRINDRHSSSLSASQNSQEVAGAIQTSTDEGSLENIPTVLEDYQANSSLTSISSDTNMSVLGFQDIINGPLSQYLTRSTKIGGDVAKHAALVKAAFDAQLQYLTMASHYAQPSQDKQMELLKPTSAHISAIQDYREKNRASPFFNHLSAISESIPALGWVCVSPTPGPHVKEMNDAGQFYTNRVLKEWKEKDATHVEWARSWVQTLTELQSYIKQYHTTGLVWSGKGAAGSAAPPPPPSMGGCPPPPPPPAFDLAAMSLDGGADERSALFAEINQGEGITRNLKKVTADMQTHKNPTLRTGPAPFKATQFGAMTGSPVAKAPLAKEPVFTRDGKKWIIEHQKNNAGLLVENAEMNNVVYMFKCEGSTLTVKGKVNNIVMDSCKKCSLLFDAVVASVEFVNCQSIQMQVLGSVPTISIDKTDGCHMYLSKGSAGVEIISSKSSEMNVMLPEANGDYTELALPEQFKTTIAGKTLKTVCVDSLG